METVEKKLDKIITYLSSINHLLLYGDHVNKDIHSEEVKRRIDTITQATEELHPSDQHVAV